MSAEEPSLTDLLDVLADPATSDDYLFLVLHWAALHERMDAMTLDQSLEVLAAAGKPLRVDEQGLMDPHRSLILAAVAAQPEPACRPALLAVADTVPSSARVQVVRSMFEIASRSSDAEAASEGFRLLEQYLRDGLVLTERDDPLYWLGRQPVFPEIVLPALGRLAQFDDLVRELEQVRSAYVAAGLVTKAAAGTSALTPEYLVVVAERDPAELVALIAGQVAARLVGQPSLEYEIVAALPPILQLVWAMVGLEGEVLNGGLNQYFWNPAGQFAVEARDGLEALDMPVHAEIVQSAMATFAKSEPELRPFRLGGSLEAFAASYELATFDALDERFVVAQQSVAVSDVLATYLLDRIGQLVEALAATP